MEIVKRWRWGARRSNPTLRSLPVSEVYIHHSAMPLPKTRKEERAQMRSIDAYHFGRGWQGIGYLFAVGPSGTVYEGRRHTWAAIGAHTEGRNSESVGIVLLGNFEVEKPTDEMIRSAADLIVKGMRDKKITRAATIKGHGAAAGAATACPGKFAESRIDDIKKRVRARI